MKKWINAFFMAWGMFLAVPCPYPKWDEEARDRMLVCLPLIGLIIGGVWVGAAYLSELLIIPRMIDGAVMASVPWLMTGFIHLDGFMDVSDAVLSRRDLETRQKILKDPHVGAFAVISIGLLFLFSWSVFCSWNLKVERLLPLALIPVVSRASAGMAVIALKPMQTSQYNSAHNKKYIIPLAVMLAAAVIVPIIPFGFYGLAPLAAAVGYWLAVWYGTRKLGGMSGDVSGFALTLSELVGSLFVIINWEAFL